jgi:hypothetical protein
MVMFAIDFNPDHAISRVYLFHDTIQAITLSGDFLDFGQAPQTAINPILNRRGILVEFGNLGPVAEHVIDAQK